MPGRTPACTPVPQPSSNAEECKASKEEDFSYEESEYCTTEDESNRKEEEHASWRNSGTGGDNVFQLDGELDIEQIENNWEHRMDNLSASKFLGMIISHWCSCRQRRESAFSSSSSSSAGGRRPEALPNVHQVYLVKPWNSIRTTVVHEVLQTRFTESIKLHQHIKKNTHPFTYVSKLESVELGMTAVLKKRKIGTGLKSKKTDQKFKWLLSFTK